MLDHDPGAYQHAQPVPILVQLGVTYRCNLTCEHCYALDLRDRREFTLDELGRLADELAAAGAMALTYSHGESLIRRDFLDIARLFAERGFHQTLMNNGFYVRDPSFAAALVESGIDKALVSLDHTDPQIHNQHRGNARSYRMATGAVGLLKEAGMSKVGFSVAIDEYNYGAIASTVELAVALGLTDVSFMQTRYMSGHTLGAHFLGVYKSVCREIYELSLQYRGVLDIYTHDPFMLHLIDDRLRDDPASYASFVGANVCNVGTNMVSIDPVGNVTGCNFLRESFGNVREEPFQEIWERLVDHYRPVKKPQSGACTGCSVASSCSTGCLAFHQAGVNVDARCSTSRFPEVSARPVPVEVASRPAVSPHADGRVLLPLAPKRTQ
ncbi:radical SAM/SPASM domain-containing protein [Terracoccus luteus]|uniref:Radical SAM protein with 4Fe4S-binding SPASM domain n=1 Tax=Terracoccus luteus TaxID=53356 RepID=A0A839PYL4_9MICO|nr:radical SAM protein [Terracoccus luteus]MBB2988529.1 radical SAM protein with 4Fe4S-binding SPASM domain [Terracoccus luteus]MCP2174179.1 radical SAM protein with 4Fe4S-binding SPASM domain [Terracoccus luteus]